MNRRNAKWVLALVLGVVIAFTSGLYLARWEPGGLHEKAEAIADRLNEVHGAGCLANLGVEIGTDQTTVQTSTSAVEDRANGLPGIDYVAAVVEEVDGFTLSSGEQVRWVGSIVAFACRNE